MQAGSYVHATSHLNSYAGAGSALPQETDLQCLYLTPLSLLSPSRELLLWCASLTEIEEQCISTPSAELLPEFSCHGEMILRRSASTPFCLLLIAPLLIRRWLLLI